MPKLHFFVTFFYSNEQKSGETRSHANLMLWCRERRTQRTFSSSFSMIRTMSLPSADRGKWQKWQKRQDLLVKAAEMAWNVMIRNNIDLAMAWHDGKSVALSRSRSLALSLALWPSLALALPLSLSFSLSRFHSCSLAFALSLPRSLTLALTLSGSHTLWLALTLSRSLSRSLAHSHALSLSRFCALSISLSYFTKDHFRDEGTKTFPWNGGKKYRLTPVEEMTSFMILAL